jgi:hypothetical protein
MEFINNLFWLPINSIELIFNIGLWVLIGWIIFESVRKYRGQ